MVLNELDRVARHSTRWLSLVGFVGLFLLAVMTTLDALLRSFFSAPIHGVNDVSAVVMAVVIASCIPANLADRRNISVAVLGAVLGRRSNRILTLFSSIVVLAFISLMAWEFIPYTQGMFDSNRRTWVLAWPVWPWWSAATVFLVFAAIIQASNVIHDLIDLLRPKDFQSAEEPADAARSGKDR